MIKFSKEIYFYSKQKLRKQNSNKIENKSDKLKSYLEWNEFPKSILYSSTDEGL